MASIVVKFTLSVSLRLLQCAVNAKRRPYYLFTRVGIKRRLGMVQHKDQHALTNIIIYIFLFVAAEIRILLA